MRLKVNLVMKGGVSSGLVYARLVACLEGEFSFCRLAGASAGAIAASLTAAAEFARRNGDPKGFQRVEAQSEALALNLKSLFQPSTPFRPLFEAVVRLAPGSGRADYAGAILCFLPALGLGAILFILPCLLALVRLPAAAWPWVVSIAMVAAPCGALLGLVAHIAWLIILAARSYNFGICDGRAVMAWVETALRDVAGQNLTFGDLRRAGIELRMVTSSLSLTRPLVLPDTEVLWFDPHVWARLFPEQVMERLAAGQSGDAVLWRLPEADDLPILVALRMSIACPGLFEQVPVYLAPDKDPARRVYLSDGGLTINFPFGLFAGGDAPTLALDLETIAEGEPRLWTMDEELSRPARVTPLPGPLAFCWSVLRTMREGENRAAMRIARPDLHIFRIGLLRTEGGMNLSMTTAQARALMARGAEAGAAIRTAMRERP